MGPNNIGMDGKGIILQGLASKDLSNVSPNHKCFSYEKATGKPNTGTCISCRWRTYETLQDRDTIEKTQNLSGSQFGLFCFWSR